MPKKRGKVSEPEEMMSPVNDRDLAQLSQHAEDLSGGLSKEDVRELGTAAATALSDPTWTEAFNLTLNEILASWLQSERHETELRESLWLQAVNLQALESVLVGQINAAQQVNLTEAEQAEADLNRYENEQGFMLNDVPGYNDPLQ